MDNLVLIPEYKKSKSIISHVDQKRVSLFSSVVVLIFAICYNKLIKKRQTQYYACVTQRKKGNCKKKNVQKHILKI